LPALTVGAALVALVGLGLAWQGQGRIKTLEQELVRRQESSQSAASTARDLAKQSQEQSRDTAAKVALLEARLAEVALQREQLESLMQSMTRSRDENVVGDIEAALRVAMQQSAITGSAEPLVAALKQADERLLRYKQPRLEGVRRAVARDLDRVKAISVVDVSTLSIKLDEVVRLVDELPLLSSPPAREEAPRPASRAASAGLAGQPAKGVAAPSGEQAWWQRAMEGSARIWSDWSGQAWREARSLLRVTRIDHPEAALMAPEQSFFLRENLKLRLLNARLALLSRQFDIARNDLNEAQSMLERYFDARARKQGAAAELLRQVQGQARQVAVPRPDDTLAALGAVAR
jgi:uroporphyrin-3 C-methyltransferase